jgi:hypothetical protein
VATGLRSSEESTLDTRLGDSSHRPFNGRMRSKSSLSPFDSRTVACPLLLCSATSNQACTEQENCQHKQRESTERWDVEVDAALTIQ